jgi:hypothetical protein
VFRTGPISEILAEIVDGQKLEAGVDISPPPQGLVP